MASRAVEANTHTTDWLARIIRWQFILNFIRAVPVFVLEEYWAMLCIFATAVSVLSGSHSLKTLGRRYLLVYCLGLAVASLGVRLYICLT